MSSIAAVYRFRPGDGHSPLLRLRHIAQEQIGPAISARFNHSSDTGCRIGPDILAKDRNRTAAHGPHICRRAGA